jgi:hypothetical protein
VEIAQSQKGAATGAEAVKEAEDKGMDTMDAGVGGHTISIPHVPEMKIRGFADARADLANQNLAVIGNTPGSPTCAPKKSVGCLTLV